MLLKFQHQKEANQHALRLGQAARAAGVEYDGRAVRGVTVHRLPFDPDDAGKFPGYGLKSITRGLAAAGPAMLSDRYINDYDEAFILCEGAGADGVTVPRYSGGVGVEAHYSVGVGAERKASADYAEREASKLSNLAWQYQGAEARDSAARVRKLTQAQLADWRAMQAQLAARGPSGATGAEYRDSVARVRKVVQAEWRAMQAQLADWRAMQAQLAARGPSGVISAEARDSIARTRKLAQADFADQIAGPRLPGPPVIYTARVAAFGPPTFQVVVVAKSFVEAFHKVAEMYGPTAVRSIEFNDDDGRHQSVFFGADGA